MGDCSSGAEETVACIMRSIPDLRVRVWKSGFLKMVESCRAWRLLDLPCIDRAEALAKACRC